MPAPARACGDVFNPSERKVGTKEAKPTNRVKVRLVGAKLERLIRWLSSIRTHGYIELCLTDVCDGAHRATDFYNLFSPRAVLRSEYTPGPDLSRYIIA